MTSTNRDDALSYERATLATASDLYTIAETLYTQRLSSLTLPELKRISDEVARIVPAGNVPGYILSGLARLGGRSVDQAESRRYVSMLLRGVRHTLGTTMTGAFFAGTAAALHGYQLLLRMIGKDADAAFPDGTWQFYLEFALREDNARHAIETTGFQTALLSRRLSLSDADLLAAWLLAAAHTVQTLPALLANEWRERVLLRLLAEQAAEHLPRKLADYRALYTRWEAQRPYTAGTDARSDEGFPTYRRRRFESFHGAFVAALPRKAQEQLYAQLAQLEQTALPAYQQQMSWLARLLPESFSETRSHYPPDTAQVGIIWQGRYWLLPLAHAADPQAARAAAAAILMQKPRHPAAQLDDLLTRAARAEHAALRKLLDTETRHELDLLAHAPVLLNWDLRDAQQPLAAARAGKRGVGDHALTILRTTDSMLFDQSHIFFDGAWGAAMAEIMTGCAVQWAGQLAAMPWGMPVPSALVPLTLKAADKVAKAAFKVQIAPETSAESTLVDFAAIASLRRALKQRSEQAVLTVNDLLILYRGLHARLYQPSPTLSEALRAVGRERGSAARKAHKEAQDALIAVQGKNPAVLIPIDASRYNPRDRVYPTTFRNPITEFLAVHQQALTALRRYQAAPPRQNRDERRAFTEAQMTYLRLIGGFGELLRRYRDIALRGESTSTVSIKLLAYLPEAMQRLFDSIPGRLDALNEIIKGEEVFSNVGRVSPGSSLRRFITAKDDNQQKTFAWGVITDDRDTLRLSLRDFRPHVQTLLEGGYAALAQQITQDYLDAYALGLNAYVAELREIAVGIT